ncbi:MAG: neutral/alkaline non-lysosomal ceramidase N-terminal domain-containing protein [Planctomycetaceae bacterium]|nr:neutral/alkaline non-lysosomal ceramidase N-terminal domain-containing protein [Planctomycetaceae bacterium]
MPDRFAMWLLLGICLVNHALPVADGAEWKAAAAKAKITPTESMWMAGYASRNKPSEGVAQDLFAKALVIEDSAGKRLAIVTLDLIGVPRALREAVEQQARQQFGLPPEALLMNASHTHCGPELRVPRAETDAGTDSARAAQALAYSSMLQTTILKLIGDAIAKLEPVNLSYSHARCGFAMNRRLPTDNGYQNSPYPDGPVDHDVPVLRIEAEGKLRAILFGYACHNTTLSFYQFCGDYAGYAQEYLEAAHPEAIALFVTGCGADQNPYPRGQLEQCQQHGRALANAVEAALLPKPKPVSGPLKMALDTAALQFAPPPDRAGLEERTKSKNAYESRHAKRLLDQLDKDGKIPLEYPYLAQVIRFGNDLTLIALSGEVVVDYSVRLKRELAGETVWMAGYSNDVFGYVPSQRVLKEGGYEAGGAMLFTSLPGPFADDVEERIHVKVRELLKRTK